MREVRWAGALFAIALTAIGARELRLRAFGHQQATRLAVDVYYLPPARLLPVLALGYSDAAASIVWCRALVYYGEELLKRRDSEHLFDYVDAVLVLDPEFRAAYLWASSAGIYRTTRTTQAQVRAAIRYLERGVRRFPDDGEMHYALGATYAFELGPLLPLGPRRDEARALGYEELAVATRLGAGPAWLAASSAEQLELLGRRELALSQIEQAIAVTRDDATRARLLGQLAALRSQSYVDAFRAANDGLREERLREVPYVSDDLYLFLRRGVPALDPGRIEREGWLGALDEPSLAEREGEHAPPEDNASEQPPAPPETGDAGAAAATEECDQSPCETSGEPR